MGKRTWKFYTLFLLYIIAVGVTGYIFLWDEIEKIRELIPEDNRNGKDNCYNNPLLNVQIWTKESHFHPFYQMQEVVAYFDCLQTEEALDEVRFFYISYNVGAVAAVTGIIGFFLAAVDYAAKYAIEVSFIPFLFGSGEGAFIYFLAGKFLDDGVGGLTDIYCQICSCLGIVFWSLYAFILLICFHGFFKKCCRCSKDRQKGRNVGTCRDDMTVDREFRICENEIQPAKSENYIF